MINMNRNYTMLSGSFNSTTYMVVLQDRYTEKTCASLNCWHVEKENLSSAFCPRKMKNKRATITNEC